MDSVYVVTDSSYSGGIYSNAYRTYDLALAAVKQEHKSALEGALKDPEEYMIEPPGLDATESSSGVTEMYIEKDINIEIRKLQVVSSGGAKAKTRKRRSAKKMR
jgi:hypothetical protein